MSREDDPGTVTLPPTDMRDEIAAELKRRKSERTSLPTLRVIAGPDTLRFCSIYPEESATIGRDPACALPLTDVSVSRHHATVSVVGPLLCLEDLGSTNGTTYDGEPVVESRTVEVGHEIGIGAVTLRIERLGMDELTHLARVVSRLDSSSRDPLTRLLSRQYLDDDLPEQVRRYYRAHVPMAAVFLDVDHFKRVNDTYGHSVGDTVLSTIATILRTAIRESDTAIRYGGEEFLLVLPNCDEQGGVGLAERIRELVQGFDWPSCSPDAPALGVTISAGVAEYQGGGVLAWVDRADRAMYRAKQGGRNRVFKDSE